MIFIDTTAFLARYLKRDQYHHQALKYWNILRDQNEQFFTSNFVLDETFTLLGRWAGHDFAADRARNIYASKVLNILRPDIDDEIKALAYFTKFADKEISFTDCISFVLMNKKKIRRAFSFDNHFKWAGYFLYPKNNL